MTTIPQQKLPQQKAPHQETTQQKAPHQETTQHKATQQKIPQQKVPQQKLPQQKAPHQETTQHKATQQKIPQRKIPHQKVRRSKEHAEAERAVLVEMFTQDRQKKLANLSLTGLIRISYSDQMDSSANLYTFEARDPTERGRFITLRGVLFVCMWTQLCLLWVVVVQASAQKKNYSCSPWYWEVWSHERASPSQLPDSSVKKTHPCKCEMNCLYFPVPCSHWNKTISHPFFEAYFWGKEVRLCTQLYGVTKK